MKPEYAIQIIHAAVEADTGVRPFSNGTEADYWFSRNCERCRRAMSCYDPDKYEQEIGRDGGVKMTEQGLNCFGEYAIAVGYMTGNIPEEILEWMGGCDNEMPEQCRWFTDDENYDHAKQGPPPDPNQLQIPFLCVSLFGFDDPNILVFDKAIIEKDVYSLTV